MLCLSPPFPQILLVSTVSNGVEYILSQLGVGCVPSQPLVHPQPVEFCGQVRRDRFGNLRASLQGQENTALLLALFKPQIQNTALYGLL